MSSESPFGQASPALVEFTEVGEGPGAAELVDVEIDSTELRDSVELDTVGVRVAVGEGVAVGVAVLMPVELVVICRKRSSWLLGRAATRGMRVRRVVKNMVDDKT